ncbi:aminopeptidase N [Solenopsis invicta]|uniref:aminopeptidase N n=1 Tax=Solenopsis invicta TaxID=13686 RepID=UPI00193D3D23|nr:aminopeptidase N [Solenopsis invicta]
MAIVKSLLAAALLFFTGEGVLLQDDKTVNTQIVEDSYENQFRLRQNVVPIHYDIKLIPHIVENNFTTNGETNIDVEVRESTNAIELHVVDLAIDESLTKLTRKDVDVISKSEYVPKQHEYNSLTQILTLRFEELLDPGIYTLHFTFTGVIYSSRNVGHGVLRGLYRRFYYNDEGNKIWLVVTHFRSVYARQAFPCWDEPAIKATFKLSIKHCPNYTALSNMPSVRSEIDEADGKLWTYFETTPIMSTYLLGFVIADYGYVSNLDGNVKIWGPKHLLSHATYSLDIVEKAKQELEKFTNSTVPVPKMDHVAIPHYGSRVTENWGMMLYTQDVLLGDKRLPLINIIDDITTITHEVAHQWFGNLVTSVWWKYFWLNEGITTYLHYSITDKLLKEKRFMDYIIVVVEQRMLNTDSTLSTPIHINIIGHSHIFEPFANRTVENSRKSAFLFRMLSHFLTEDVFQNGLIKYLQAHAYSSATSDDLWKALQDALDESDVPHDHFKVKDVMDTWFKQAWYPLVTVHRDYATGEIKITQEIFTPKNNFNYRGNMAEAWWIPINFATQSNLDFSSTLATHWLKPQYNYITINGVNINDWIIVNKHLTGFYRVNYDATNWKRIAAFLNSDNYDKIPVLNRAQILDDAYNMVKAERLELHIFVEIINYLSRETDPAPWWRFLNNIWEFNDYLRLPEGEAVLKPFLSNLMCKLFERIDNEGNPGDLFIESLRMHVYKYECVYGLSDCQAKLTSKLLAYVEDPISNNEPLFQQEKLYCFGLIKANESLWERFMQAQQRTFKSQGQFLGCSENLHILEKHLNFCSKYVGAYSHDLFNNMFTIFPTTDVAIKFFINNHENIHEPLILQRIINNSFREEELDKIKAFAEQYGINIQTDLNNRKAILDKMNNNLLKFLGVLKNIQSVNTFNNDTS